jgi:hypothetical protein
MVDNSFGLFACVLITVWWTQFVPDFSSLRDVITFARVVDIALFVGRHSSAGSQSPTFKRRSLFDDECGMVQFVLWIVEFFRDVSPKFGLNLCSFAFASVLVKQLSSFVA